MAVSRAGRAEKALNLCVEPLMKYNIIPIPVVEFVGYVSKCHENGNKGFTDHFKVGPNIFLYEMQIAVHHSAYM